MVYICVFFCLARLAALSALSTDREPVLMGTGGNKIGFGVSGKPGISVRILRCAGNPPRRASNLIGAVWEPGINGFGVSGKPGISFRILRCAGNPPRRASDFIGAERALMGIGN